MTISVFDEHMGRKLKRKYVKNYKGELSFSAVYKHMGRHFTVETLKSGLQMGTTKKKNDAL